LPGSAPSLRLFMQHVLAATGTEFLPLDPLGMHPAILVREVVPIFAIGTLHDDFFSRHNSSRATGYRL
jgi:hypothetical protein